MSAPNLIFNILTFDWPETNQTFYFSEEENCNYPRLHKTLFPKNIETIFPSIKNNTEKNFISTSYSGEIEGFIPISIDFKSENPDLIKRFYNRQINFYFARINEQIVRTNFIKENQIWLLDTNGCGSISRPSLLK